MPPLIHITTYAAAAITPPPLSFGGLHMLLLPWVFNRVLPCCLWYIHNIIQREKRTMPWGCHTCYMLCHAIIAMLLLSPCPITYRELYTIFPRRFAFFIIHAAYERRTVEKELLLLFTYILLLTQRAVSYIHIITCYIHTHIIYAFLFCLLLLEEMMSLR